jgi:hypothetical protein
MAGGAFGLEDILAGCSKNADATNVVDSASVARIMPFLMCSSPFSVMYPSDEGCSEMPEVQTVAQLRRP